MFGLFSKSAKLAELANNYITPGDLETEPANDCIVQAECEMEAVNDECSACRNK